MAFVHSTILLAATSSASKNQSLPMQQLAVSVAAHDALQSLFLAQYQAFDLALKSVEDTLKLDAVQSSKAADIGTLAAITFRTSRIGDGVTNASSVFFTFAGIITKVP